MSAILPRAASRLAGLGLRMISPASPSMMAGVPGRTASSTPGAPSTAGRPSARSITAVWLSAPPSAVMMPANWLGRISAASEGRSSRAARMLPGARSRKLRKGWPERLRRMRRAIFAHLIGAALAAGMVGAGEGQDRPGLGFGLVGHRRLGVGQPVFDAAFDAADQPRGAEHVQIGVDQRFQLRLAMFRQAGQPRLQFAELVAGAARPPLPAGRSRRARRRRQ